MIHVALSPPAASYVHTRSAVSRFWSPSPLSLDRQFTVDIAQSIFSLGIPSIFFFNCWVFASGPLSTVQAPGCLHPRLRTPISVGPLCLVGALWRVWTDADFKLHAQVPFGKQRCREHLKSSAPRYCQVAHGCRYKHTTSVDGHLFSIIIFPDAKTLAMNPIGVQNDPRGLRLIIVLTIFLFLSIVAVVFRIWGRRIQRKLLVFNDYALLVGLVHLQRKICFFFFFQMSG